MAQNQPSPILVNPHLESQPFFWESGAGGTNGVLLVHGFTATTAEIRPLARTLKERGYTVAGPLLPGHGTTPADANRYHWRDWVAHVEQAYQDLRQRCTRVAVGGESTGGLLALYLAAQHPEIAAVMAYAPALRLKLTRADTLKMYLAAPFVTGVPKKMDTLNPLWQGYPVNPLKGAIELLRLQKAVRRLLPQVHQPLLVVQGKLDPTVSPEAAEIIYREAGSTDKELHWMDQSLHCVLIEAEMEQVTEISTRFLERVLPLTP